MINHCDICGAIIPYKKGTKPCDYKRRKYCDNGCLVKAKLANMMNGKKVRAWTDEEKQVMRQHYYRLGTRLQYLLPHYRTSTAILTQARRMKLTCNEEVKKRNQRLSRLERPEVFTDEENEIIQKYYLQIGDRVAEMLPGRTKKSAGERARNMGLRRLQELPKKWTEEEKQILKDHYYTLGTQVQDILPTRTQKAISTKAGRMNLSCSEETKKRNQKLSRNRNVHC